LRQFYYVRFLEDSLCPYGPMIDLEKWSRWKRDGVGGTGVGGTGEEARNRKDGGLK